MKNLPIIGEPKKYYLSKQDLNFLIPRNRILLEHQILAESVKLSIDAFIMQFCRGKSIDPMANQVDYNIDDGVVTVIPQPPKQDEQPKQPDGQAAGTDPARQGTDKPADKS